MAEVVKGYDPEWVDIYRDERDEARGILNRIASLHQPESAIDYVARPPQPITVCRGCECYEGLERWPCPTARILIEAGWIDGPLAVPVPSTDDL